MTTESTQEEIIETTIVSEEVEPVPVEENIPYADVVEGEMSEEDGVIQVNEYKLARLEDDGRLGIPIFKDRELKILKEHLKGLINIDDIAMHQAMMRENNEAIKIIESGESVITDIKATYGMYIASRNILIDLQKAYDDYMKFIHENRDEIMASINKIVKASIDDYISENSAKYNIEYTEGSFKSFMNAVALTKYVHHNEPDKVYDLFNIPKGMEFDDVVLKINEKLRFFVSNCSESSEISNPGYEERELIKMISKFIGEFNKIEIDNSCTEMLSETSQKTLLLSHTVNLAKLVGKKSIYKFVELRKKYDRELKQLKISSGNKNATLPIPEALIRYRFDSIITETAMKEWFSLVMFEDKDVMKSKELFFKKINAIGDYSQKDVMSSIITTFSYRFIFDELENIVTRFTKFSEGKAINSKDMKTIKNYLVFIAILKYSEKDSENSYNIPDLYNTYIQKVITKLVIKAKTSI